MEPYVIYKTKHWWVVLELGEDEIYTRVEDFATRNGAENCIKERE